MEKNKAIQLLERLQDPEPYEPMLTKDAYDAIQMAIDALSANGDTISRKAAIEVIDSFNVFESRCDQIKLEQMIGELPPANNSEIPNSSDMISRAKAIDGKICVRRSNGVEIYDDYVVPVEYLEQLPPAQLSTNLAEVGTDLISRQAAIDALRKMQTYKLFSGDDMLLIDQAGAQTELMMLPPAQPSAGDCWGCNCPKMERLAQPAPSQVAKDIARIVGNENDMRVIAQGRIRGRWIPVGGSLYQCDQCGVVSLKRKFCSECGANMRGEQDE